jgi:hypothetical protein
MKCCESSTSGHAEIWKKASYYRCYSCPAFPGSRDGVSLTYSIIRMEHLLCQSRLQHVNSCGMILRMVTPTTRERCHPLNRKTESSTMDSAAGALACMALAAKCLALAL